MSWATRLKAVLFGVAALCSQAWSAPVTFQFTGTVLQVPVDDIYMDIANGAAIQGSFTFDSAALDLIAGPESGSYTSIGLPYGMTVTVGAHLFSTSDSLNVGISDFFLSDMYTVLALNAGAGLTLELFLSDSSGSVFASDALPLTPPSLAAFQVVNFSLHQVVDFLEVQVDGQLDSLTCSQGCGAASPVPEPGTALLGLGGALLILLRRKFSKTQEY